jgi:hypothetical protein
MAVSSVVGRGKAEGEEHMKFIFVPLFWLMIPLAFIVVVFDVAKSFVEDRVEAKFKEKNT